MEMESVFLDNLPDTANMILWIVNTFSDKFF